MMSQKYVLIFFIYCLDVLSDHGIYNNFSNFTKFKSFIFKNLENDTRPVGQVSDVNHGPLVLKITYIKS